MNKTKEQFAAMLNGREYGGEITEKEAEDARRCGLLVIYGASDDLMEFAGAFHDELGIYDGGCALVDRKGVLPDWDQVSDEEDRAADYLKRKPKAKQIKALWCEEGDYSWTFKTEIPHATFEIVEDGHPYCRGIVLNISDLVATLNK